MKLPGIGSAALCLLVLCPLWVGGQATQPSAAPAAATSTAEEHYPDQGFLSPARYTNQYFGFAFDLPPEAHLQPIPRPAVADSRIQLLQLGGPPPADAAISIAALPTDGKPGQDARALLRKELDHELFIGVEELHGLSKATLAGHQFWWYETRRGIDHHVTMATSLNSYAMIVLMAARDEKVLSELQSSFQHVVFFAPSQARQRAGADAQPYEGPAVSIHRLAQLKADPPAGHIDPGEVRRGVYKNPALGFSYRIPQGWTLEAEGAVEPALETANGKRDFLGPAGAGSAERELTKVCERTLFSAWAQRPGADGYLSYDDFGEVTVSAAPAGCFPGMKFPADSTDREAIKDFLLQFGLTHPIQREMGDAKAFSSGGNVFIFLHGKVALKVSDDELTRRLSIGMSITCRRGYLLTWFFAAPHDTELKDLLEERASFDPEAPVKDATATKPGGGAGSASANGPSSAAQPTTAPAPVGSTTAEAATSNGSATQTTPSAAPQQESGDLAVSPKPTLLRPGETMQDQQAGGKPIPKH